MENISFNYVEISDDLFKNRIQVLSTVSILGAIKKCYATPRIKNFVEAKKVIDGGTGVFEGIVYDDADVYKIMEGAAYILSQKYNQELEQELNKLIDIVIAAQEADGYITTKHTINQKMKWVCLDAHEMYNFGHLIEATVAHYLFSGNKTFLNTGIKAADYLVKNFLPDETNWLPGHQEIELALLKLYRVTENQNYKILARKLLETRGYNHGFVNLEYKDKAVFIPNQAEEWNKEYHQDSKPLKEITKVEGHAVRAMYMYTAMAEIAKYYDYDYLEALERVWHNLIGKNMYITGGIGSTKVNEGFTKDYDLPNETAYCETCASVGMVFWNSKMFEITKEIKYLDVIEREIKNGALSGLSADGNRYFYDNPLSSSGDVERQEWFETSCCPTQLMRFIPQIANYIYYEENLDLYIAQPISSHLKLVDSEIEFTASAESLQLKYNGNEKNILIRRPLDSTVISCSQPFKIKNGFIEVHVTDNSIIDIQLNQSVKLVKPHSKVRENVGKVACSYNGFVYCAEEFDNNWGSVEISNSDLNIVQDEILGGMPVQTISLYKNKNKIKLIPYFAWNNRSKGKMLVWLPYLDETMY